MPHLPNGGGQCPLEHAFFPTAATRLIVYPHHLSAGHYPIDAMFGSHNTYGGYNSSYAGNAPFYPPPSNPDPFWGNKHQQQQQQNRLNYRNQQDAAIANDSLYGYQNNNAYPEQSLDGSLNHIEAGLSGLNIDSKQSEDFGPPSFASIGSRKTTTWASIASQPAKSQPKSLKSKMAASGLTGSTSKHLPPTVTMDAMSSWESKANGSMAAAVSGGGKTIPPPAVIAAAAPSIPPPPPIIPNSTKSTLPIEELPSPPIVQTAPPLASPPQRPPPLNHHAGKENSWTSNGNSSSSGSISTSASSPRPSQAPILPKVSNSNNNGNSMRGPMGEVNENYSPNKYSNNQRSGHLPHHPPHQRDHYHSSSNNNYQHHAKPLLDNPPYSVPRNLGQGHPAAASAVGIIRDVVPASPPLPSNVSDDMSRSDVEKLFDENDYNPKEFDLSPRNARFFIIKSYSEDDVHRSIKYSIWCSTDHGNKRLDNAFRQQGDSGPIYLFYSVNRSGHFCGVAQMMSPVDYNASAGVWAQDKWKGQFQVKWIYVKDVPNDELRHITLENNENKPVTNSRDTQEVPYEKGKKVLAIIHNFEHRTSIFDDFLHYEKKQEEEQRKPDLPASPPPVNTYSKMPVNPQFNSGMPPRDNQMPFRGSSNSYGNKHRSYPDQRERGDFRGEYRGDHRGGGGAGAGAGDYRTERNDYRNDRMDRPPAPEYGRDSGRSMEHRNEYRDNHSRDGREYREYREHREPQFHREQPYQRDFHQPTPRDYPRERNEYRPPQEREHRDFRDHRDQRVPHERHQQSWRN